LVRGDINIESVRMKKWGICDVTAVGVTEVVIIAKPGCRDLMTL
jgi:hypothetical protein